MNKIQTVAIASLGVSFVLCAVVADQGKQIESLREDLRNKKNLLGLMNRCMVYVMKHELPEDFNPELMVDLEAYLLMRENGVA